MNTYRSVRAEVGDGDDLAGVRIGESLWVNET